ncbi:MAG: tetratricopeptide repeat protein, partial [Kiritimatiellae bacterium]|nr:tetratricopeptide repeat protein [Kiritimatiellia bacterium]
AKEWKKAREIYSALLGKHPQDGNLVTLLKDTEARMTMAGGWEDVVNSDKKEGFRDLIRNKEEASKLDMKNKATVAEGDDAEALIADQKAKIAKDPRNINYYRGLARIYQQLKRYDEAVEALTQAREINSSDPELDRMLTNVSIQAYDSKIEALIQQGKSDEAEELRASRNQFVFDDLVQRVERYPNDLRLRFELGQQYLMYDAYDDAIQQFQLSQRSPKERTLSLHGLAKCFRAKGQRDMAVMQLETALEQLHVMDDTKKAVLFDLGEMAEEAGDIEKAFKIYREIYGADIAYKDIDAKMQRIYKLRQEKQAATSQSQN